ncbi:hypothetical protein ACXR0O_27535 [Verrucomicrobiota bacterium sgz303538]
MFAQVRSFFARHPLLRDALLWALPAIIFGAVLRLLFLSYLPYAYWGSDSKSYFNFAQKLVTEHYISLDEKRRFLYPILMAPIAMLPGATLKWLVWIQHTLGLATLLPLAYIVRKTLVHWRLWIVPVTVAYAGLPMILWYEHELLGETVFFGTLLWAFAGWVAWANEPRIERTRRLFWWFFVPFTLFILTKPSGRFVWPGICAGLLLLAAWRRVSRRQWIALGVLVVVTLTVGSRKQGAWLLYVSTFPLTQLDSPLYAEYKAEIRDMVEPLHRNIDTYYLHDDMPFRFLEDPTREAKENQPLWSKLGKDAAQKSKVYTQLALEGIKAEPLTFLYLGWQRIVGSINLSEFKESRFTSTFYPSKFAEHYGDAAEALRQGKRTPVPMLFGMPAQKALPPYEEFQKLLAPAPDSFAERAVLGWVRGYEQAADFVTLPQDRPSTNRQIWKARILPLGVWLLAGMALAFTGRYRSTLGVWTFVAVTYLAGVFLVGQANPRYLCPAWPVLVVILAVPADVIARLIHSAITRSRQKSAIP